MARSSLTDYLQSYPFWLMDIAPIEALAVPIFTPMLGFSAITAPEISIELTTIVEANWFFSRKVLKQAEASNLTLMRASKWYDSDFYQWMMAALSGDTGGHGRYHVYSIGGATPRRDLLLVHFLSHSPIPEGGSQAAAAAGLLALQGVATGLTGSWASLGSAGFIAGAGGALASGLTGALTGSALGPFEVAPRLPAKAWVLYGCLPTRYKAAGDFDATDSAISIQELEVAVEYWDELSLGSETGASVALGVAIADAARTPSTR